MAYVDYWRVLPTSCLSVFQKVGLLRSQPVDYLPVQQVDLIICQSCWRSYPASWSSFQFANRLALHTRKLVFLPFCQQAGTSHQKVGLPSILPTGWHFTPESWSSLHFANRLAPSPESWSFNICQACWRSYPASWSSFQILPTSWPYHQRVGL